jgi:hypothetical protein
MSQKQSRRRRGKKPKAADLWKPVPTLDPPAPIARASDATAVLASLGDPPLKGQGDLAKRHIFMVAERAADAAVVLAHVAGLAATTTDDDDL